MRLRFAAHSEVGLVRKNNQDSGYASSNLLVVADGMGGAAAGDLASAVAIDTIRTVDEPITGERMLEVLTGALHSANGRIADLVDNDYALEGMGTTVTGVLFDGTQLGLAHIGDSRAYLLHDSHLERLTHDHSWVQSLVDSGKISQDEAAVHPHRSLLLKVLNGQPANDPDVTLVRVEPGDRLLLCSDGLCGLVDDPVIEAAMRVADLDSALRRLVQAARAEGGIDNITVILADVVESNASEQPLVLGAAAELTLPRIGSPRPSAGSEASTVATAAPGQGPDEEEAEGISPAAGEVPPPGGPASASGTSADDEARYSPQPPLTRRRRRSLVAAVLAVLVAGGALASAYAWTRTQFFVGAAGDRVAIFRGLDERLAGVPLSRLYEVQPLAVSALPPYYQERVRASIDVSSLNGARLTVTELTDAARRCRQRGPSATASSTTGPSATSSLSARPGRVSTPSAAAPGRPAPSRSTPGTPTAVRPTPRSTPAPSSAQATGARSPATPRRTGSAAAAPPTPAPAASASATRAAEC